jgi:ABC-type uncharacterized transport system fused permease/ATPase subunit
MANLPLPYAQFFQLVTAIYAAISVIAVLWNRSLEKSSRYYGFSRAFAIFMIVVTVFLVISYIAQATFMGWI